jgi:hypothetical protein
LEQRLTKLRRSTDARNNSREKKGSATCRQLYPHLPLHCSSLELFFQMHVWCGQLTPFLPPQRFVCLRSFSNLYDHKKREKKTGFMRRVALKKELREAPHQNNKKEQ